MDKLQAFCKPFSNTEIQNVAKIGRRYYQAEKRLLDIKEKINADTFSLGLPLGEEKKDFTPSPALLEILAQTSDKKVFLTKKGEWMFLCKRDVFQENITKKNVSEGLVLVQNSHDENIGLGELKRHRGKVLLKVILDRGDYLRRER